MKPKHLVKILLAIITFLTSIVGVLDPGAFGNATYFVTSYQEHSEDSDHGSLNALLESNPSPEAEKEIHLTVSPTQSTKDTSSINKVEYHHTKRDSDVEEVDDSTTGSVDVTNSKYEPRVGDKEVSVSGEKVEPPSVDSFKVDSNKITSGKSTKLSWSVSGATDITISPSIGSVPSSGSTKVSPTEDTTYTITATNGMEGDEGTVTKTVTVYVEPKPEPPQIGSFYADSENIIYGDSTTLSWSVSGATDVTIDQGIGSVPSSGSTKVSPTEDTTYTITATNGVEGEEGTVTEIETVYVEPKPEPPQIDSFYSDSENIVYGDSTTLSWSVSGATDVTIDQGIGSVPSSGSTTVSPTEDTTYTITATNEADSVEDTAIVYVDPVAEPEPSELESSEDDSEYFV